MSNIQTRSTLGDLGKRGLGPKFEQVFEQNLVKYTGKDVAAQIFSFENTDMPVSRDTGLTGFGLLQHFNEGSPYPSDVNIKLFETVYTIRNYGKSVEVTEDCLEDRERLGAKLDEMAQIARMVDVTEVKAAFQILVGGASTAQTSNGFYIDRYNGEELFTASHTRADGGTAQSNVSASNIALTETNLETGRLALIKQLTDRGLPVMDMGTITLVVPDDLEKNAVIYTDSELRPSSANNDINFYRGRIGVISSRWLNSENGGSATAWYLKANLPGMNSILKVKRQGGPRMYDRPEDAKTGNLTFAVKHKFTVGYSHWVTTWRSAGA